MTVESSISFFITIVIFAITPGPGVFALLGRSLSRGYKSCFSLAMGMTVGDISYLIAASLGLAVIASSYEEVFIAIRVMGALYLFYLAYLMWVAPLVEFKNKSNISGFVQGAMISFSNPKVILFYIAFLPTFIDLTRLSALDIIGISFLTFVALMIGLMAVALFADKLKRSLRTEKGQHLLNRTAATLMGVAGGYLLWSII